MTKSVQYNMEKISELEKPIESIKPDSNSVREWANNVDMIWNEFVLWANKEGVEIEDI